MYRKKIEKLLCVNNRHKLSKSQFNIFSCILLLCTPILTYAVDKPPPTIHLVTEHLPPYQIAMKNKTLSGFSVDIIKKTMEISQYHYSMKSYPWVRSYNLAQQKTNHCIFSIARLKSREHLFKWVGPMSKVNNTAMWARKDKNIVINNLEQAKAYTIAVNRNDIAHTGLIERGFKEQKHLYVMENVNSLISILFTRPEIDLIVADDTTINFRAKLAGINVNKLEKIFEIKDLPLDFYFACNLQTDDKIVNDLANSLEKVYQDGSYELIWQEWKQSLLSAG